MGLKIKREDNKKYLFMAGERLEKGGTWSAVETGRDRRQMWGKNKQRSPANKEIFEREGKKFWGEMSKWIPRVCVLCCAIFEFLHFFNKMHARL
jgi:hypothetical protein